jgi:rhomboid family GlyGly-CTERM serine protease
MRLTPSIGLPIIVLAVLVAEILFLGPLLEYRRPLLPGQPWRLWTGHFVHLSLVHALLNSVALLLLGRLFDGRLRAVEFWGVLLGAPLAISLVFWAALPELQWYRGLSGALHAVYFAGCTVWLRSTGGRERWLAIAALAGGALKVLLEQPWDASVPFRAWLGAAVVPQAHLVGALAGVAAGLFFAARRQHQQSEQPQHPEA